MAVSEAVGGQSITPDLWRYPLPRFSAERAGRVLNNQPHKPKVKSNPTTKERRRDQRGA